MRDAEPSAEREANMDERGTEHRGCILLVEDNSDDIRLIWEAFREAKILHHVYFVSDGIEASEFLRRRGKYRSAPRPDLILLDLHLPRKGGLEMLSELKRDPGLKQIPVIVLTASEDETDIMTTYGLHANCYITKPATLDRFMCVLQEIGTFWFTVATLPKGLSYVRV
jgi:two-component system, chemotaxis family, response regulator Rcp1